MTHLCFAKMFPFERLVNEIICIGMDMEEEDKNVFYSLLTKTAKEHLKNQICMYMYLFSFLAEEELAHQSWKSV